MSRPIQINSYNKYSNTKVVIDNIKFDSKREAKRYRELKLLLAAKRIRDLTLQPKFILQEGFFDRRGQQYREIAYIADFTYIERDQIIVEDCKGMRTKEYLIKKKLFLYKFRDFLFQEI